MGIIHFNSILLSSLVISIFISTTYGALQQGFTVDLIHRDSPKSPLYNPSLNNYDRLRNTFQRSVSRINRFSPSSSVSINENTESKVIPAKGEYIMEVSIGTPPVTQLWIVDTGSDLIWTQCLPCLQCYKQNLPIFNPKKSSTYKVQPCESKACQDLSPKQGSCSSQGTCGYTYSYGDNSNTSGDLATDTLTFESKASGGTTSDLHVSFGCGHDNEGTFREQGSGLIGLGGGPLSLVSQLSSSIGGKFSYCLIPFFEEGNFTSKINFGDKGEVSGHGVVSTPLTKQTPDTFYFLTLEAISVGDKKISAFASHKNSPQSSTDDYGEAEGNIIIDSGTTLTLLPSDIYDELSNALTKAISGEPAEDPTGSLQLCYAATKDLNIPNIIAHFTGADVVLNPVNTFIQVSDGVVCLAMVPAQEVAIFGNLAQGNFLVGYDLDEGKVSFKPTDCTKGQ